MKKIIHKIKVYPKVEKLYESFYQKRRVAIYARVSTSSDEQLNSIEAQRDYYLKYVEERSDLIFAKLYADEGITGTSQKMRVEFQKMMSDAKSGAFDLIITKSISRFARNTVDSLICIRLLKEYGIEVYFQKEDIGTFDSKGEFMITLLSSMAQEESRSISENVAWGHRKRFADGKYSVAYDRFLGYDRGSQGGLVVNQTQAILVRLIFKLYLEGKTPAGICRYLNQAEIPTPGGKDKWSQTVINSILRNEKYKGDALLQKKFTVDYLTKKMKINEGELNQYYVTDGHEAIIPRDTFDYAQKTINHRRTVYGHGYSCINALASKIQCEYCSNFYGLKSAHSGKHRAWYWFCKNRYKTKTVCPTPRVRKEVMQFACLKAILFLLSNRISMLNYAINLISLSIHPDKKSAQNKSRMDAISKYIYGFRTRQNNIYITEEVLRIVVEMILATAGGHLLFRFINGEVYEFDLNG
ncbi:MAG TPA: recombinase family protein [Clostridia bacterium]|nr:recombinase family protein [Clostridia bacterium]